MGYALRVPPPLRHEMVVPCFSDASDITRPLKNHGFLMVLLYPRKSCSRRKSFLNRAKIIRELYQQIIQKGHRKRCRTRSYFLYAFWTQLVSQNEPKMAPNVVPKKVCKTSSENMVPREPFLGLTPIDPRLGRQVSLPTPIGPRLSRQVSLTMALGERLYYCALSIIQKQHCLYRI